MEKRLNDREAERVTIDFYHRVMKRRDEAIKKNLQQEIISCSYQLLDRVNKDRFSKQGKLLKTALNEIEEKANQIAVLADKLEQPFLLFAIGMGKYGKSTLVNALVGKRVAEVDQLPKTWKIDIFEASDSKKVEVVFKDGSSHKYNFKDAKDFIREEERKREKSELKREEKFQNLSSSLKSIEAKEELWEKLSQKILYKSEIAEVHWPHKVDQNSLLNQFRVVDTPGLWQESDKYQTQEDLRGYYHKSDGVLWMLDATTLASQQPKKLLAELDKAMAKIGGKTDNIIAVLNRIDLVRKNKKEDVKRVVEQAREIFAGYFYDIVAVSAKEAIDGLENNDFKLYKKSGLPNLRRTIENYFWRKASRIQTQSKANGLKGYLRDIKKIALDYKTRLKADEKKRKKLAKDLAQILEAEKKQLKLILKELLDDYKHSVLGNIESYAEKLFDFEEGREDACKKFIRDRIFIKEEIATKLNEFQSRYEDKINFLSEKLIREAKFSEFKHIDSNSVIVSNEFYHEYNDWQADSLDISESSTISSIGAVIAGGALLGPIGFVLGVVANSLGLVKWAVVQFKLPGLKKELKRKLQQSIGEIRREINSSIDQDFGNIRKKVDKVREGSFASLHISAKEYKHLCNILRQIESLEKIKLNLDFDLIKLIKKG